MRDDMPKPTNRYTIDRNHYNTVNDIYSRRTGWSTAVVWFTLGAVLGEVANLVYYYV